jgi:di/tricarboxylate transporter
MNAQLITFTVLGLTVLVFLRDRLRPDLVAMLAALVLGLTGVLTPQETFSGFSRSAVITILAISILAEGLQRTGVTEQAGNLLARLAGAKEGRMVGVVMLAGAVLSLFMNNISAASVLLPAVSGAARKTRVSPSKLLMPLAFGTLLGGMATLLTTTNIVVSNLLRDQNLPGFGLLDFAPLGMIVVMAGILYMLLVGRHWLPAQPPDYQRAGTMAQEALFDTYRLGEQLICGRIQPGSPLAGATLCTSGLREQHHLNVLAIRRGGRTLASLAPDTLLQAGDLVLLECPENLQPQSLEPLMQMLSANGWNEADLETTGAVLVEAVLAPRSGLIGHSLREAHFRARYGVNVVGVWRAGKPLTAELSELQLQFGDALLLQGLPEKLNLLRSEPDLILLTDGGGKLRRVTGKAWLAFAILLGSLILAVPNPDLTGVVMLAGGLLLVLTRVLSMDQAYRAIEWKTVFLVAGVLPLGVAMSKTGAAALIGGQVLELARPLGPLGLLAGLFLVGVLLTQVMHGAAVAVILAPIAVDLAVQTGLDPRSLAMGVALATSMAFITPLGHPVNLLVMTPGGYKFRDFVRVGLPLSLLLFALVMLLLPVFWPLGK